MLYNRFYIAARSARSWGLSNPLSNYENNKEYSSGWNRRSYIFGVSHSWSQGDLYSLSWGD